MPAITLIQKALRSALLLWSASFSASLRASTANFSAALARSTASFFACSCSLSARLAVSNCCLASSIPLFSSLALASYAFAPSRMASASGTRSSPEMSLGSKVSRREARVAEIDRHGPIWRGASLSPQNPELQSSQSNLKPSSNTNSLGQCPPWNVPPKYPLNRRHQNRNVLLCENMVAIYQKEYRLCKTGIWYL